MVGLLAVQILIRPELAGTRDAANEKLRVEVRTAGEGEYLAVTRVHRDDSPSSTWVPGLLRPRDGGVELILGQFLHVEVHGQLQILARHGLGDVVGYLLARVHVYGVTVFVHEPAHGIDPAPLRDYAPEGVHVVGSPAWFTAQHLLVGELDPTLAYDRVSGQALERFLLKLIVGNGAGVSEDVGGQPALWVASDPVVVDGDTPELPGALANVSDRVTARVLLDQDRAVLATGLLRRVVAGQDSLGVGPDDGRQLPNFVPGDLIRYDGYVQPGDVVREDLAVAVVDHTALGGDLDVSVLRRPRGEGVVLACEHLQVPQPCAKDEEDRGDHNRQRDDPHLHVALGHRRRLHALFRGVRLLLLGHRQPEQPLPLFLREQLPLGHFFGLDDQTLGVIRQRTRL